MLSDQCDGCSFVITGCPDDVVARFLDEAEEPKRDLSTESVQEKGVGLRHYEVGSQKYVVATCEVSLNGSCLCVPGVTPVDSGVKSGCINEYSLTNTGLGHDERKWLSMASAM